MSTTEIRRPEPAPRRAVRMLVPARLVWVWLAVSVLTLPLVAVTISSYDYPHGWVSAHHATMARSFVEHGVVALGSVPVQNNPPLTQQPDAYLNWPPLYPLGLAMVFSALGESEVIQHLVAAAINLAIAALIFAMLRRQEGALAAALAAIAFLNAPILARYGHLGVHLHLALLLCLASLWAFARAVASETGGSASTRRWAVAGTIMFAASVLASWEPVLAAPGLFVWACLQRDRRALGLAALFGGAGAVVVASVFAWYWLQYPYFGAAILERVLMRAGLAVDYDPAAVAIFATPHFLQERHVGESMPLGSYIVRVLIGRLRYLGPVGLAGLALMALLLIVRPDLRRSAYPVAGLAAMYGLWAVLMSHHMRYHDYQVLMLAPLAALAVGIVTGELVRAVSPAPLPLWLALALGLGIPAVAVAARVPATLELLQHRPDPDREIGFAWFIRDRVEPGAVVAHPSPSMVPVYYSERHLVRSVSNEKILAEQRAAIEGLCAECPVYMAVPSEEEDRFAGLIASTADRQQGSLGTIITLRPPR